MPIAAGGARTRDIFGHVMKTNCLKKKLETLKLLGQPPGIVQELSRAQRLR
jgi:hypothetical protein